MSIAIQWGYGSTNTSSRGFVYFDAVTSFEKTLSGSVSKNPIDGGGLVTDHFTKDNPTISLSCVVSAVDISYKGKSVNDFDGNRTSYNRSSVPTVKVEQTDAKFYKLLPDVVGQFFRPSSPKIVMETQPTDVVHQIKILLESLFADGQMQLIKLYEYDLGVLRKSPVENLVLTSLRFREDEQTGDALYCDLTLEQVTFTFSKEAPLDSKVTEALQKAATEEQSKGKADSTTTEGIPPLLAKKPDRDSTTMFNTIEAGGEVKDAVSVFLGGGQ